MCGQTYESVIPWIEGGTGWKPREAGHAPAQGDNRFPRMGGKPSKGTKKDKRLKKNKGK